MRDIFVALTLAVNKARTYEDFRSIKSKHIVETNNYVFDTTQNLEEFAPLAFRNKFKFYNLTYYNHI